MTFYGVPILVAFGLLQINALKIEAPPQKTEIKAAKVVENEHMKASKAISTYMDASKETLGVWKDVKDAHEVAPATLPTHMDNLIKSQKTTSEAISKMKKASDLAVKEQKEAEKVYKDKEK